MNEKITLNDGTELYGWAEEENGNLYVYVYGKTFQEVYDLMTDPEKTEKIVSKRVKGTYTYENFTHMISITEVDDHFIAVTQARK